MNGLSDLCDWFLQVYLPSSSSLPSQQLSLPSGAQGSWLPKQPSRGKFKLSQSRLLRVKSALTSITLHSARGTGRLPSWISNTPGQALMLRNSWLAEDGLHLFLFLFSVLFVSICAFCLFILISVWGFLWGCYLLVFLFSSNIGFPLCNSPVTHSVDQAGFKPSKIHLPLFAKFWD